MKHSFRARKPLHTNLLIIWKIQPGESFFHHLQYLLLQEEVFVVIIVAGNDAGDVLLFFEKIDRAWIVPKKVPVRIAADEFRRPRFVAALTVPSKIDAPLAARRIQEVIIHLRRAPTRKVFLPFIEFRLHKAFCLPFQQMRFSYPRTSQSKSACVQQAFL